MVCTYCGSNLHTVKNCPKTWQGAINRQHMYCSYCGSTSHSIEACPSTFKGSADRSFNEELIEDFFVKD